MTVPRLHRVLSAGDRFRGQRPLILGLVGKGPDAYLWIGSDQQDGEHCFGTLDSQPLRSFLVKALGQVFPDAAIVTRPRRQRRRR